MQTYSLKFILIGDSGVGKSQLARRFTKKTFVDDIQVTVGMEFSGREIQFEKCTIKAYIWDTAGQIRFENVTKAYYQDAVGALLVYDVTNPSSFENLKNVWMTQLNQFGHEKMTCVLVGNKADTKSSQRRVSSYDAATYADSRHLDFIETSALTGENVEKAFRRLVLSAAKLLPDIKVHLDLTGLPDGWIANYRPAHNYLKPFDDTTTPNTLSPGSSNSSGMNGNISNSVNSNNMNHNTNSNTNTNTNINMAGNNIMAYNGQGNSSNSSSSNSNTNSSTLGNSNNGSNGLSPVHGIPERSSFSRSPSANQKSGNKIADISIATPNTSKLRGSIVSTSEGIHLLESPGSEMSMTTTELSLSPSNISIIPDMITVYTNYWTGEETLEVPKQSAPTGFFYEARTIGAVDNRFSEFDQPIKRETLLNPDYSESMKGNSEESTTYSNINPSGNVIVSKYDAITTYIPKTPPNRANTDVLRKKSRFDKCGCVIS